MRHDSLGTAHEHFCNLKRVYAVAARNCKDRDEGSTKSDKNQPRCDPRTTWVKEPAPHHRKERENEVHTSS